MLYKERGKVMRKTAVYYVDINAPVNGNGSRKRPFRHINDAAHVALPGDEVVVLPGIYREYVTDRLDKGGEGCLDGLGR